MNKEMSISELKSIICDNFGELSRSELSTLAVVLPNLQVGVKLGYGPRIWGRAGEIEEKLAENFKNYSEQGIEQYIREAFITCSSFDKVKDAFGWETK